MKKIFILVAIIMYGFIGIGFCADKVVVIPLFSEEKSVPCNGTLNGTRWCDNGDGTVTDLLGFNGKGQGLVWLKWACCFNLQPFINTTSWEDAQTSSGTLSSGNCGLSDGSVAGDWRLPTMEEMSAFTQGTEPVSFNTPRAFDWIQTYQYWTSSTSSTNIDYIKTMLFITTPPLFFEAHKTTAANLVAWPVRNR